MRTREADATARQVEEESGNGNQPRREGTPTPRDGVTAMVDLGDPTAVVSACLATH